VWINVTDADVARLCHATGLSAPEVVRFPGPGTVEGSEEDDGWVAFGEDPNNVGLMTLRTDPASGACRFLVDDQCSVYADRPRACRLYPWDVELTDDGPRIGLDIFTECPHDEDGSLDVHTLLREYQLDEEERQAYEERIWDWEDIGAPDDPLRFLRFLGLSTRHSSLGPPALAQPRAGRNPLRSLLELFK
jgi:Fe-S-cluster containining protein